MIKSATDIMQDVIDAAVIDAVVAVKDASRGLPNALLRDLNAIHANTAPADLPRVMRESIAASVRDAFARLQKGGYVVAESKHVPAVRRPEQQHPRRGEGSQRSEQAGRSRQSEKRPRPQRGSAGKSPLPKSPGPRDKR